MHELNAEGAQNLFILIPNEGHPGSGETDELGKSFPSIQRTKYIMKDFMLQYN